MLHACQFYKSSLLAAATLLYYVAVSETRLKEIMIDTPPQITPSTLSLTKVTPITGQSTVWTSPPYGM